MENKKTRIIFSIIFISIFFYALSLNSGSFLGMGKETDTTSESLFELKDVQTIFPEAGIYKNISPNRAEVYDNSGKKLGQILNSQPDCEKITGFAGPIPLLIGLDSNERVASITVMENHETPAFISRVLGTGILSKWQGQTASDAVSLNVDAVTGATMSSSCIIKTVRTRLANHAAISVKESEEQTKQQLIELTAWLFLIFSIFSYHPKSPIIKYRKTFLVISVLLPGFMLGRFFSIGLIRGWAIDGIPYSTQLYMTVVMALAIFLPIFTGRSYYCTWYCPFGAAQELCMYVTKKKFTPSPVWSRILSKIRPILVLVICGLIGFGYNIDAYQFEPFAAFLFKSASTFTLAFAIIILLLSMFVRKPWCTYCCPTGCFLEANRHVSQFNPKTIIVKAQPQPTQINK